MKFRFMFALLTGLAFPNVTQLEADDFFQKTAVQIEALDFLFRFYDSSLYSLLVQQSSDAPQPPDISGPITPRSRFILL